ncbi:MAG TPA: putative zinc-binding metallopeptidase [Gemmatimonadaceae bacterium]|nr:putative zinc-binding metallopeptidase [Gemmatimonadaceae bacterium]
MSSPQDDWESARERLLSRRISDLGLTIRGSLLERMVDQLYAELGARGLVFRPPVYLSDQWGCPDDTPLIGAPFYLADPSLARLEEEMATGVETAADMMRYLRHEAGHAFNYAYRLYDRGDWRQTFGPYSRPYRERFHADPFSREYVRHILGWYAQKHPDEDFAETFAVWLTPALDWRRDYEGWPALGKLEYVDRVLPEVGGVAPSILAPTDDDLPVEAMHYTLADHYRELDEPLPIDDERHFDGDLRTLFASAAESPAGDPADDFLRRHRREIVGRIAYWTGESAYSVRAFLDFLAARTRALGLRVRGLEASTLIELTAFGTAVMMNYRYTDSLGFRTRVEEREVPLPPAGDRGDDRRPPEERA